RLCEDGLKPGTGTGHRRLCACIEELRLDCGRLLRRQEVDLCGASSKRIHAGVQRGAVQAIPWTRSRKVSLRKSARKREGPVGRRPDPRREDMSKCRWLEPHLVAAVEFA